LSFFVRRATPGAKQGFPGFSALDVAGLAARCVLVRLDGADFAAPDNFLRGAALTTTFLKRQKEMKRVEKSKMKEQQRAQRKLDKAAKKDSGQSGPEIDMNPPELDIFNDVNYNDSTR
jgi:hypothetical protein